MVRQKKIYVNPIVIITGLCIYTDFFSVGAINSVFVSTIIIIIVALIIGHAMSVRGSM